MKAFLTAATAAFSTLLASSAFAQDDLPVDGSISMRAAASPIAEQVHDFHNYIMMPVMVGISVFVLALLVWVLVRYNAKSNKVAQKFSHNTLVEVIWTLGPVVILIFIAIYSFELLFNEGQIPDAQVHEYEAGTVQAAVPNDFIEARKVKKQKHLQVELVNQSTSETTLLRAREDYDVDGFGDEQMIVTLEQPVQAGYRLRVTAGRSVVGDTIVPAPTVTIKATGFQWGWTYGYPDFGDFEFDSLIAPKDQVSPELFRFATTNDVVVPVGETIRVVTTGRDVIHSWAMPAFAVKIDAVPGRLNETWFLAEREGMYYGQCSEICGIDHAYMPISVRVVSRPEFEAWVDEQREFGGLEPLFAAAGPDAGETTRDFAATAAPQQDLN
ncbi:cytochrome c oxidase subunit II transmembrane domain-containing protein [Parvularcula sp. LCG005]|uniref:cytochrome c oxidase subunit II transmembrane domain-containing protein n=1 Tax=Parvularcula sp. LCG005 TaxID=3078805 RepID=UPI00294285CE|nr:cytochrome c oxidase subunit II transmembrane domain-containing protein [Parvularcula sp. LCG005]WOI53976.1 cytochrome c oxidase subunit II transmembrane domain-containing protein [Parvularcula sp. LCG005]